jgi:hypothetical protein
MTALAPIVLVLSSAVGQTNGQEVPTVHEIRHHLQVLKPLIGTWEYEFTAQNDFDWDLASWSKGDKITMHQTFKWIMNDTAVEREIVLKSADGKTLFGFRKELIAWVPQRHRIESRYLRSHGEFGTRTWSRKDGNYILSTETTDKESRFSAFDQVLTMDGDTLKVQNLHRTINGEIRDDGSLDEYNRIK